MITVPAPLALGLGPTELLIIFAVIVLLFGASKLPDLARGSGRAIRIFKAETKGVLDDDDDESPSTPELGKSTPTSENISRTDKERSPDGDA
jgi:sec-independent protein translocase protein TatA